MKIAVQLFGHLRDFEKCAPSLNEYILKENQCDVFIHTWDVTDHDTKSWHGRKSQANVVNDEVRNKINELYNPKLIKIEQQHKYESKEINYLFNSLKFSTATLHYMFYSMNAVNEMRKIYESKNNMKYDLILVTRPDVEVKNEIDFNMIIKQASLLNLSIENCRFFASKELDSSSGIKLYLNQPNDLLFFGRPNVINKYIEINTKIDDDYASQHCINVVSIYTSNEIRNGITPIPIAYQLGKDWTFMGYRMSNKIKNKPWSSIKKSTAYFTYYAFKPIKKIYQFAEKRYPWLTDINN